MWFSIVPGVSWFLLVLKTEFLGRRCGDMIKGVLGWIEDIVYSFAYVLLTLFNSSINISFPSITVSILKYHRNSIRF